MANRTFKEDRFSLLNGVTDIFARVLMSGTTPLLQKWTYPQLGSGGNVYANAATTGGGTTFPTRYAQGNAGVFSVARTGAGLWTVTFQDFYTRLLSVTAHQSFAGGLSTIVAVGENTTISAMNTASNGGSIVGVALLTATATPGDPADATSVSLHFILQNASEP